MKNPNNLPEQSQQLQQERGALYGDFLSDMRTQSRIMMELLAHRLRFLDREDAAGAIDYLRERHLLDDMAPIFMSAVKSARAATGKHHPDHRFDAANYDWARDEIQKQDAKKESKIE